MDGARFANAVASLGCQPKEITWQRGVNVLSFGGTKNGLAAGELVVFFDRELAREFDYRVKQGGQLASKTRFLAAPWTALLANDVWLKNARHANEMARLLEEKLRAAGLTTLAFPREANALFVHLPDEIAERSGRRGWQFLQILRAGCLSADVLLVDNRAAGHPGFRGGFVIQPSWLSRRAGTLPARRIHRTWKSA